MLPQTTFELLLQNIEFLVYCISIFILIYIDIKIIKRIKKAGFISATSGLAVFITAWCFFLINFGVQIFYPDFFIPELLETIRFIILIFSSLIFIIFTEKDKSTHIKKEVLKKFHFPLTVITVIGLLILVPLKFLNVISFTAALFLGIMDVIIAYYYFRIYSSLKIAQKNYSVLKFIVGMIITGATNSLLNLQAYLGYIFTFLYCSLISIGILLMLNAWQNVPVLSDLEWYYKMDRLFVVNQKSSILLYEYAFKKRNDDSDADLAGSMFGGITKLLKEVLASNKSVNVIDHGDRKVFFSYGLSVTSILIVEGESEEYEKRLDLFTAAFESEFRLQIKEFKGNLTVFKPTIGLIIEVFSRN